MDLAKVEFFEMSKNQVPLKGPSKSHNSAPGQNVQINYYAPNETPTSKEK